MKMKNLQLLNMIGHRKEVTVDDLGTGNKQRLLNLVSQGKVVESRTGSWSGDKYYKLSPNEQEKFNRWHGVRY